MIKKSYKLKMSHNLFGSLLIILSLLFVLKDKYEIHYDHIANERKIDFYFKDMNKSINNKDNYIAVIEIPIINLKRGLYKMESPKNNVKEAIEILKNSNMPNVQKSNLILASHSGNGKNAYFNKIKKLSLGDSVYIYYDKYKYIYVVKDIYEVEKTGKVLIKRDKDINTLTMITCNQIDKSKQIIVISELIKKDNIKL